METAGGVILLIYLLLMAVNDIRKKEIHLGITAIVGVILAARQLYLVFQGEMSAVSAFLGILTGIFLIVVSVATEGQIGIGDGLLFVICGLFFSLYETGVLLLISLFLTAAVSGIMIVIKRAGKKDTIPFAPFVLAGYGVMCLWKLAG